jgi:hypothetical protein
MKTVLILIIPCLALTGCGKKDSTEILPEGYQVKEAGYYNMTDCIQHAKLQIEKKKAQKVGESNPNRKTHVISVTVPSDMLYPNPYSARYICHAEPYPNATLTIAVKPGT